MKQEKLENRLEMKTVKANDIKKLADFYIQNPKEIKKDYITAGELQQPDLKGNAYYDVRFLYLNKLIKIRLYVKNQDITSFIIVGNKIDYKDTNEDELFNSIKDFSKIIIGAKK